MWFEDVEGREWDLRTLDRLADLLYASAVFHGVSPEEGSLALAEAVEFYAEDLVEYEQSLREKFLSPVVKVALSAIQPDEGEYELPAPPPSPEQCAYVAASVASRLKRAEYLAHHR